MNNDSVNIIENYNASVEISSMNRGVLEKITAMAVLGLGSFICGLIPGIISEQNRRRFPLTNSLAVCFGGGVLLATALVHILPEVRESLNKTLAEITLCAGFLIVYLIDEVLHSFVGHAEHASQSSVIAENQHYGTTMARDIGEGATAETEPLLQRRRSNTRSISEQNIASNNSACHTHNMSHQSVVTRVLGLFVALTLHSAIEGIAIGVQNSASKVLFLLGAVATHKFVMSFCLGLELCTNLNNKRQHMFGILVFALGAVLGIGIGMLLVDMPTNLSKSVLPILQALAGGTLVYVTACEVISREKSRHQLKNASKAAGIFQCCAVIAGFIAMTLISTLVSEG